jgi:hypothetical protein
VTGTAQGVRAADVIKALGKHLRLAEPLAGPSERDVPEQGPGHAFEAAAGDLRGACYAWGYRKAVEADFTCTCGSAAPAEGRVRTWEETGTGSSPARARGRDPTVSAPGWTSNEAGNTVPVTVTAGCTRCHSPGSGAVAGCP